MRLSETASRFRRDQQGNFAIITALMAVPVIGLAGLAVDYSRAADASDFLQGHSDAMALAVSSRGPAVDSAEVAEAMRVGANEASRYGVAEFEGQWINASDYRVTSKIAVPVTLAALIPGAGREIMVTVEAVARYQGARYVYKPPTFAQVAPEAGDFNRISAYCFSANTGRSQFVDIADNVGTQYENVIMPECKPGEVLSYKLTNVEWGKNQNDWSQRLASDGKSQESSSFSNGYGGIYYYYTDTSVMNGVESYDLQGNNILETILCDTMADCKPKSEGGILPNNTERNRALTRQRAAKPCGPDKYMYYGWEDRPPGTRDSDADFDDIRVVIGCPEILVEGYDNVSLIR